MADGWLGKHGKRTASSARGTRQLNPARRRLLRLKLFDKQGGMCAICGEPMQIDAVSLDHIRPISSYLPGDPAGNHKSNFQATHVECNVKRGGKPHVKAEKPK